MDIPSCVICGNVSIVVCSSSVGAISHAYCQECLDLGREEWNTLIGGLFGLSRDNIAGWMKSIIEATCAFYGKTEDDLWNDIARIDAEYEEYCETHINKGIY